MMAGAAGADDEWRKILGSEFNLSKYTYIYIYEFYMHPWAL